MSRPPPHPPPPPSHLRQRLGGIKQRLGLDDALVTTLFRVWEAAGELVLYWRDVTTERQNLAKESKDFRSPWGRWLPRVNHDLSVAASWGDVGKTWKELGEQARADRDREAMAEASCRFSTYNNRS